MVVRTNETVMRCDAVVPTTAVAGAVALADIAGAVAPVDLAGTYVPAVAGTKFSAVAEVHSSAVDDEGDPSVIRTCRQWRAVVFYPMAAPRKDCGPMDEMFVLEPLEHLVLEVSLEGGDRYIDELAMPYPLEHSGVSRAADLVSEMSVPEPLEHSVLEVPLDVGDGSVGSMTVSDPQEPWGVSVHAEPLSACLPFLMTSVVLPLDSEIVAPFSVSGVRLGSCALVELSRSLAEEYGVVVGHMLVDASSRSASVLMINPNTVLCPLLHVWQS